MKITDEKAVAPVAFSERCAIRCIESKFGPNSNGDPMVTTRWELCGILEGKELKTEYKRGATTYKVAGLPCNGAFGGNYFTLSDQRGANAFADLYFKATGEKLEDIDEENPPREFLDGLVMQALVISVTNQKRKTLTKEEIAALKADGKKPQAEAMLDEDGKPMEETLLQVAKDGFIKKYSGEVPA